MKMKESGSTIMLVAETLEEAGILKFLETRFNWKTVTLEFDTSTDYDHDPPITQIPTVWIKSHE